MTFCNREIRVFSVKKENFYALLLIRLNLNSVTNVMLPLLKSKYLSELFLISLNKDG